MSLVGDDIYNDFFPAVRANDQGLVAAFLRRHPESVRATIPHSGRTPLHVAVLSGHLDMVKLLLQNMNSDDLEIAASGFTAFAEAVCQGMRKDILVKMVEMNPKILEILDEDGMFPVARAFVLNYSTVGAYLYSKTPTEALIDPQLQGSLINGATVLTSVIRIQRFGIAAKLLDAQRTLALARDFEGKTPFFAIACSPFAFLSGSRLSLFQKLIYPGITLVDFDEFHFDFHLVNASTFISVEFILQLLKVLIGRAPTIMRVYQAKRTHQQSMPLLSQMCDVVRTLNDGDEKIGLIHEAILEATDRGLVEFIEAIAKANPDLLASCVDRRTGMNVLQHAIRSRHAHIYGVLLSLPSKEAMLSHRDNSGNHALHIAGMIAPSHRLSHIPGAALRMQREMQWFKKVEKTVPRYLFESKNKKHMTPGELFTTTHKGLIREGETWIKETSSFCVLSGSLIITIMFAAAITVPGATDQKTGFPMFRDKKMFRIFMVSDILSVFLATTSLFEFLGVNGACYAEEDFLSGLLTKITLGVALLLFSILTMVISFCSVVLMMFEKDMVMLALVGVGASILSISFISRVFPLLAYIFVSTYGPIVSKSKTSRS